MLAHTHTHTHNWKWVTSNSPLRQLNSQLRSCSTHTYTGTEAHIHTHTHTHAHAQARAHTHTHDHLFRISQNDSCLREQWLRWGSSQNGIHIKAKQRCKNLLPPVTRPDLNLFRVIKAQAPRRPTREDEEHSGRWGILLHHFQPPRNINARSTSNIISPSD